MRRITRFAALVTLVAVGANCGGSTENNDPKPGTLVVELTTPNTDDAAIKLTITSPVPPTAITAPAGLQVFRSGDLGTTTTVIVTGAMEAGPILRISVPDTRQDEDYSAAVVQVASTDYVIRDASGYSLEIDK